MALPAWLEPMVAYDVPTLTLYALFFLLGSFTVAGWSDIKRMTAQREFLEVWILFAVVLLGIDVYYAQGGRPGPEAWMYVGVKWGLIALVGLLSWRRIGGLFRLARADVFAIVAVAALFNPLFIVLFVVLLKLSDVVFRVPLRAVGSGNAYPFIPVVLVATIVTIVVLAVGIVESLVA